MYFTRGLFCYKAYIFFQSKDDWKVYLFSNDASSLLPKVCIPQKVEKLSDISSVMFYVLIILEANKLFAKNIFLGMK